MGEHKSQDKILYRLTPVYLVSHQIYTLMIDSFKNEADNV